MVLLGVHSKLIFKRPMILWIGVFLRLFLWVLAFTLRWSNGLWFVFLGHLTLYVLMVTYMGGLKRRVRDSDDFYSVVVIMDALEEFKQVSGLVPSITKSTAFFCNVPNAIKASILNSMPFAEGFCFRVNDWRNKFLSLAGRLRLIRSVLSSMHIYWASIFILPNRIVHDLEQLMRGFLWCQGEMKKGKSKFTWNSVCMPKHEGGLGRSFWDVPCRGDVSWGWHKLLQIRSTIRPFIWHNINNGKSTSAWFDRWVDLCPLKDMFSNKDIARSGFSLDDSVPLLLDDIDDVILLRDRDGVLRPFSVACAWDRIRTRADIVNCYNVVWFSHCIPRHAIHMWLVFRQKLKIQERLRQWDVGLSIDLNLLRCPLCDLVPDSHYHLFFERAFSSQVWSKARVLYERDSIPPRLIDVTTFINPISKGKMAVSILFRLVLAATSYYI
ncbi:putative gag-pol polyprotein [Tanacetum coccineum]